MKIFCPERCMCMFLGEYEAKFSGHGRVILPKKVRQELDSENIVLSRGFEGCIWGFSKEGFEEQSKKQLEVSATEKEARKLRRYMFSGSGVVELDAQGRFVIPSNLMEYARIEGEVVIIGAGDHFEIWDKNSWEKSLKEIERDYARVS